MGPFEGKKPVAVYVPWQSGYQVEASTALELAVCSAPGGGDHAARLIGPDQVAYSVRGKGSNTRHVYDILPEAEPAHSLLVVEVITPAGGWSSYPSHKHDTDNLPHESELQETYYHRLNPPQGFALQRVYTDDRSLDQTMAVEDGDVVLVPRGYHPVRHRAWLRPLLPERHGGAEAHLALQHGAVPPLAARGLGSRGRGLRHSDPAATTQATAAM